MQAGEEDRLGTKMEVPFLYHLTLDEKMPSSNTMSLTSRETV